MIFSGIKDLPNKQNYEFILRTDNSLFKLPYSRLYNKLLRYEINILRSCNILLKVSHFITESTPFPIIINNSMPGRTPAIFLS